MVREGTGRIIVNWIDRESYLSRGYFFTSAVDAAENGGGLVPPVTESPDALAPAAVTAPEPEPAPVAAEAPVTDEPDSAVDDGVSF